MDQRVLVTGAAGFIGSHLVEAILDSGYEIVGVDNLNDYYSKEHKLRNIEEVQKAKGASRFQFVRGDIQDALFVSRLLEGYHFDVIIHLAAMPGVRASIEKPYIYYDVNVGGTLVLLESIASLIKKNSPPKFIFASTSSVYGHTDNIPFEETDPCEKPLAPYPATKRSCELMGYTYHHVYDIPFMALRFFTVYGPRNRPDMMAYKLAESIFKEREVKLFNNGLMYRDWTYVSDITQGIVSAIGSNFRYEVINLGRGEPVLLSHFIDVMEKLTDKKARVIPVPAPPSEVSKTFASIEKAKSVLGYRPVVSIEEGIERFLFWYRQYEA